MAIRTPEQKMIEEVYGPAHFTVNCPSDKLWQNYFIDTCDFAALAYGCTGIYFDQLASAEPYACYDKNHSHTNSGEFNNGYIYIWYVKYFTYISQESTTGIFGILACKRC